MENEIIIHTAGYLAARLAILAGFGYALYRIFRHGASAGHSAANDGPRRTSRVPAVLDGRC